MKRHRIGLVMKSLQAEFFKEMQKGAEAYAAGHPEIELIPAGTASQTEIDAQIALVEELTAQGVDALVVVPIDSKALVAPVVKAVKAGIKVVNIDIRLDEDMLRDAGVGLTYVGPDNEAAALAAGSLLADALQPGDEVAVIEGLRVAENAQQRLSGFRKAIEARGLDTVASEPADWETEKAAEVFAPMLEAHPGLKGVFCANDAMAAGVIGVLKEKGLAGRIKVVGFDNDASSQTLLDDGSLLATIDAFGPQMAVNGIIYAQKLLAGEPGGGVHATEFRLIS